MSSDTRSDTSIGPTYSPYADDPTLLIPSWGPDAPLERGDHVELAKALLVGDKIASGIVRLAAVTDKGRYHVLDADTLLWREIPQHKLRARAGELAGSMVETAKHPRPLKLKTSDIRSVVGHMMDLTHDDDCFHEDHIVFSNKTIVRADEQTLIVEPLHPRHMARHALDVSYDPDWSLPDDSLLAGYLRSTFADAGDRQRAAELMGAALLGLGTRRKKAWFLVDGEDVDGRGGTGKSQLLELLQGLVPAPMRCSIAPQDFADAYHGAMLEGKRLNIVFEAPDTDILREEGVKAIVHGEPITRRPIRQAPITFRPVALHVFAANRLPDAPGATGAFWDRWEVLEFGTRFRDAGVTEIKNIAQQILANEYGHLVHLAVHAAQWLLEHGRYTESDAGRAAKLRWRKGADPVANYIAEWCEPVPEDAPKTSWSSSSVLYDAYREWCKARGHSACSSRKFSQRIPQEIERGKSRGLSRYRLRVLDVTERSIREGYPDDEAF